MLLAIELLLMCVIVAFYLRFMIALLLESRRRVSGYWLRLRLHPNQGELLPLPTRKPKLPRAA